MSIAASMIVKNEEQLLPLCLQSLHAFPEINILDTGSTDKTAAIAATFPNVRYFPNVYTWNDNFAEARNKADSYCTQPWIFVIDADEHLEPDGYTKMLDVLKDSEHEVFSFRISSAKIGSFHFQPRLYKRDPKYFWKAAVHNYLSVSGQQQVPITVYAQYSPAHANDPDRALRILLREVQNNPKAVREVYYLARELLYKKDYIRSLYWYQVYLKRAFWVPEQADAFLGAAKCLWFLHRGEDARQMCLRAIYVNPNFSEAFRWMAHMSGPKGKERWGSFAELANDEGVLFVRKAPITGG